VEIGAPFCDRKVECNGGGRSDASRLVTGRVNILKPKKAAGESLSSVPEDKKAKERTRWGNRRGIEALAVKREL